MSLSDLFFGTDFFNRIGRKNIRGDELAALIAAEGGLLSGQIGQGCAVQRAPAETITDGFPGVTVIWTGFPNPFYDDLGFFSGAAPTRLTIPAVTPAIQRVLIMAQTVWGSGGDFTPLCQIHMNGIAQ